MSRKNLNGKSDALRFRTTFRNTIYDLFRSKGWLETESETDWDVAWIDKDWMRENFMTLSPGFSDHQRINHFPNHYELTKKDNLIKNLKRTQRALQREGLLEEAAKYDFFPGTYVLPADYGLFVEEFKNHPAGTIWIMKPTGSAQGKGIFLFNKCAATGRAPPQRATRPNAPAHALSRWSATRSQTAATAAAARAVVVRWWSCGAGWRRSTTGRRTRRGRRGRTSRRRPRTWCSATLRTRSSSAAKSSTCACTCAGSHLLPSSLPSHLSSRPISPHLVA
jgi:hypothetical protein